MTDMLRWAGGGLLFIVFLWLAAMNGSIFWQNYIKREKAPSWVPLVGGVFGTLSLLLLPIDSVKPWWWVPLIVDFGCVPGIVHTLIWGLIRATRGDSD